MNILEAYDQFTTGWAKLRAHVTSHLIAAGLLLLIGFSPPLPVIGVADVQNFTTQPIFSLLQNLGFLALLSVGIAVAVGAYAILLNGIGGFLLFLAHLIAPPTGQMLNERKQMVPREALFVIAATLPGGCYRGHDLGARFAELLSTYATKQPEEFRKATADNMTLQRDATTYYRNALVFILAWILIPWLFAGRPLGAAVDAVFWRGLLVLFLYAMLTRARLFFALRLAYLALYVAVHGLVLRDPDHAGQLAAARANPEPYWRLVDAFCGEGPPPSRASLFAYVRFLAGGLAKRKAPSPGPSRLQRWIAFGEDPERSGDYGNPAWLGNYLRWRLALVLRGLRSACTALLIQLGLRAL